ncbi:AP2 domain transcription factor AP2VIIa-4 [Besnoitia besnoiti]|uniref:AP2 domain transcription factor AP2VIIa-4 n=1 Tax=Besnoitia besnoiti TaxID=94643 RepID=A0A2A9MF00_BESBE|nr:AP2 domain transcription factor AP2VIIa-4 [Besnoitia besnoiti]PFH34526.1 AP2 domain transcription factor AP2VIIa-4 [Besnoitia besnoiti]
MQQEEPLPSQQRHALHLQLLLPPHPSSSETDMSLEASHTLFAAKASTVEYASRAFVRDNGLGSVVSPRLRRCLTEYDECIAYLPASVTDVSSPLSKQHGGEDVSTLAEMRQANLPAGGAAWLAKRPSFSSALVQRRGVAYGSDAFGPSVFSSFVGGRQGSRSVRGGEAGDLAASNRERRDTRSAPLGMAAKPAGDGEAAGCPLGDDHAGLHRLLPSEPYAGSMHLPRSASVDSSFAVCRRRRTDFFRESGTQFAASPSARAALVQGAFPFLRRGGESVRDVDDEMRQTSRTEPGKVQDNSAHAEEGAARPQPVDSFTHEARRRQKCEETLLQPDFHVRLQAALREQELGAVTSIRALRQQEAKEDSGNDSRSGSASASVRDEEGVPGAGSGRLSSGSRRRGGRSRHGGSRPQSSGGPGTAEAQTEPAKSGSEGVQVSEGTRDTADLSGGVAGGQHADAAREAQALPDDAVIRMLSLSVVLEDAAKAPPEGVSGAKKMAALRGREAGKTELDERAGDSAGGDSASCVDAEMKEQECAAGAQGESDDGKGPGLGEWRDEGAVKAIYGRVESRLTPTTSETAARADVSDAGAEEEGDDSTLDSEPGTGESQSRDGTPVLRLEDVSLPLYPLSQIMDCSPSTPTASPLSAGSRFARQLVFSAARSPRAAPFFSAARPDASGLSSVSAFAPALGAASQAMPEVDHAGTVGGDARSADLRGGRGEAGDGAKRGGQAFSSAASRLGVVGCGGSLGAWPTEKRSTGNDGEGRCSPLSLFLRKRRSSSLFSHDGELLLASPLAPPHPDILTPKSRRNACGASLLVGPASAGGSSALEGSLNGLASGAVCEGHGLGGAKLASDCRCFLPDDSLSLFLETRSTLLSLLEDLHEACCCCHGATTKAPSLKSSPCCPYHFPLAFPSSSLPVVGAAGLAPASAASPQMDDSPAASASPTQAQGVPFASAPCPASSNAVKTMRPPGLEPLCPDALAAEASPSSATAGSPMGPRELFREDALRGGETPSAICVAGVKSPGKIRIFKTEVDSCRSRVSAGESDEKTKFSEPTVPSDCSPCCASTDGTKEQGAGAGDGPCAPIQKKRGLRAQATTTISTTASAVTPLCTPTAAECLGVDIPCRVVVGAATPAAISRLGEPPSEAFSSEREKTPQPPVGASNSNGPSEDGAGARAEVKIEQGFSAAGEAQAERGGEPEKLGEVAASADGAVLHNVASVGLLPAQASREGLEEEERASVSSGATRCPAASDKNVALGGRCSLDTPAASPSSSNSMTSGAFSFNPFTASELGLDSSAETHKAPSALSASPASCSLSGAFLPQRAPAVSPFAAYLSPSTVSASCQAGAIPRCGPELHALFFEHTDCLRSSRCFVEQLAYAHIFRICFQPIGGGRPSTLSPLQQQFLVRELYLLRQEPNRLLVRNAFLWTGQPGCQHILDQMSVSCLGSLSSGNPFKSPFSGDRDRSGAFTRHAHQQGAYGWGGLYGGRGADGAPGGRSGGALGSDKFGACSDIPGVSAFDDLRKSGAYGGGRVSTRGQTALAVAAAAAAGLEDGLDSSRDEGAGKASGCEGNARKGKTAGESEDAGGKDDSVTGSAPRLSNSAPSKALLDPSIFLCTADMEVGAQKSALVASLRALRSLAPSWASQAEGGFAFHLERLLEVRSLHSQTLQNYRVVLQELFSVPPRLWRKERLLDALHDLDCLYAVAKSRAEDRQKAHASEQACKSSAGALPKVNGESDSQDSRRGDEDKHAMSQVFAMGEGLDQRPCSVRPLHRGGRQDGGGGSCACLGEEGRGSRALDSEDYLVSRPEAKDLFEEGDDAVSTGSSFFKGSRRRGEEAGESVARARFFRERENELPQLSSEAFNPREGKPISTPGGRGSADTGYVFAEDNEDAFDGVAAGGKGWASSSADAETQALQQHLEEQLQKHGLSANALGIALTQVLRSGGKEVAVKILQRLLSSGQSPTSSYDARYGRPGAVERIHRLLRHLVQSAVSSAPASLDSPLLEANEVSVPYSNKRGLAAQGGEADGGGDFEHSPHLAHLKQRGDRAGALACTDEDLLGVEGTEKSGVARRGKGIGPEPCAKRIKTDSGVSRRQDGMPSSADDDFGPLSSLSASKCTVSQLLHELSSVSSQNDSGAGGSRAPPRFSLPTTRQTSLTSAGRAASLSPSDVSFQVLPRDASPPSGERGSQKPASSPSQFSSRRHDSKDAGEGGRGAGKHGGGSGSGRGGHSGRDAATAQREEQAERLEYARRAATLEKVKGVFIGKKNTCWVAQWTDSSGRSRQTCYNIKTLGFEVARQKAIEERQRQMGTAPVVVQGGSRGADSRRLGAASSPAGAPTNGGAGVGPGGPSGGMLFAAGASAVNQLRETEGSAAPRNILLQGGLSTPTEQESDASVDLLRSLSANSAAAAGLVPSSLSASSQEAPVQANGGNEAGQSLISCPPLSPSCPTSSCDDQVGGASQGEERGGDSNELGSHISPRGSLQASAPPLVFSPMGPLPISPALPKHSEVEKEQELNRLLAGEGAVSESSSSPALAGLSTLQAAGSAQDGASVSPSLTGSPLVAPSSSLPKCGGAGGPPSLASLTAVLAQAFPNLASALSPAASGRSQGGEPLTSVSPEHLQLFQQLADQILPHQRSQGSRNSSSAAGLSGDAFLSAQVRGVSRTSPVLGSEEDPDVLLDVAELGAGLSHAARGVESNLSGVRPNAAGPRSFISNSQVPSPTSTALSSFSSDPGLSRVSGVSSRALSMQSAGSRPSSLAFGAPTSDSMSPAFLDSNAMFSRHEFHRRRESDVMQEHPPSTPPSMPYPGGSQSPEAALTDMCAGFGGASAARGRRHRVAYTHKQGRRTYASQARDFPRVDGIKYNVKCACWEVSCGAGFKVFSTRRLGGLQEAYDLAVKWKHEVDGGAEGVSTRRLVDKRPARSPGVTDHPQGMMAFLENEGCGTSRVYEGAGEEDEGEDEEDQEEAFLFLGESEAGTSAKRESRSGSSKEDQEEEDGSRMRQTDWVNERGDKHVLDGKQRDSPFDAWMRCLGASSEDGAGLKASSGASEMAPQRPPGEVGMLTSLLEQLAKGTGAPASDSSVPLQPETPIPEDIRGALALLAGAGSKGPSGEPVKDGMHGSVANRDLLTMASAQDGSGLEEGIGQLSPMERCEGDSGDEPAVAHEHRKRNLEYEGHDDGANELSNNSEFDIALLNKKMRTG